MESTVLDPTSYRIIDPYEPAMPEAAKELGKNDFMRLLLTQLKNQDPLHPLEDTEFIAQLAQFSSLEQLIEVNDGIGRVEGGQQNLINAQALDLIGRSVLVDTGGALRLSEGIADEIVYSLAEPAAHGSLEVIGPDGSTVRDMPLEMLAAGRWRVQWDGLDDDGNPVADGDYEFRLGAVDGTGDSVSVASYVTLRVDGVNFARGGLTLVSGDREIPFLNIIEIRTDGAGSSSSDSSTAGSGDEQP